MWDLPGPGLEPMSPALAGGFLTTVPPGKPTIFQQVYLSDSVVCSQSIGIQPSMEILMVYLATSISTLKLLYYSYSYHYYFNLVVKRSYCGVREI